MRSCEFDAAAADLQTMGNCRTGFPVNCATAWATAGAIGGTPTSPIPLGSAVLGTICVSMTGVSAILSAG